MTNPMSAQNRPRIILDLRSGPEAAKAKVDKELKVVGCDPVADGDERSIALAAYRENDATLALSLIATIIAGIGTVLTLVNILKGAASASPGAQSVSYAPAWTIAIVTVIVLVTYIGLAFYASVRKRVSLSAREVMKYRLEHKIALREATPCRGQESTDEAGESSGTNSDTDSQGATDQ